MIMARILTLATGVDLTGRDFESAEPAGLVGRLYEDFVRIDASGVTVDLLAGDPTVALIGELPEVAGRFYAVTVVVDGVGQTLYYPEGHFTHRVIPERASAETVGSLSMKLLEDGVVSPATLVLTEVDGGVGDYLATGWLFTVADWALTWVGGGGAESVTWSVRLSPGLCTSADIRRRFKDVTPYLDVTTEAEADVELTERIADAGAWLRSQLSAIGVPVAIVEVVAGDVGSDGELLLRHYCAVRTLWAIQEGANEVTKGLQALYDELLKWIADGASPLGDLALTAGAGGSTFPAYDVTAESSFPPGAFVRLTHPRPV